MNKKATEQESNDVKRNIKTTIDSKTILDSIKQTKDKKKHDNFSHIVLSGKGIKLSPKTNSYVFFDLAKHDESNELYLRISGNEDGGLHSKEWVLLASIIKILDKQGDKTFKSTILKPVFKGASSNNAGFLSGVLRSDEIGLITQSGESVFLHILATDYELKKSQLMKLADC